MKIHHGVAEFVRDALKAMPMHGYLCKSANGYRYHEFEWNVFASYNPLLNTIFNRTHGICSHNNYQDRGRKRNT